MILIFFPADFSENQLDFSATASGKGTSFLLAWRLQLLLPDSLWRLEHPRGLGFLQDGAFHVLHFPEKKAEKRNQFFAARKGRTFYKQTSECPGRSGIFVEVSLLLWCLSNLFAVFSLCSCSQYQDGLLPMNLLQKYPALQACWSTGMGSGEGQTSRIMW